MLLTMIVQCLLQRSNLRGTLWDFLLWPFRKKIRREVIILFSFFIHVLILPGSQLKSGPIILSTIKTIYQRKFYAIWMKKSLIVLFSAAYTALQLFLLRLFIFISGQAVTLLKWKVLLWKNKCHSPAYKKAAQKTRSGNASLRIVVLTRLLWLSVIKKTSFNYL